MASVTFKRGTRAEIEATAKQDGQILMETDQNKKNKMYIDLPDGSRVLIGNSGEAIDTSYDNTTSGLDATNVQSAIDTLNSNLSKKQDKLKIKDVNIKLKNCSFQRSTYFYYSNLEASDLIGSHSMILSVTIVWWARLTNPIMLQLDMDGIYLSLTIPKDSMNDWMDDSQINVRFTYL